jgi:hypothetical protein
VTAGAQATETAASDLARDWEAVRAAGDIQYAPVPPPPVPEFPNWLAALNRFLERVFGPVGELFGMSWPVVEKLLIGVTVTGILVLLWILLAPVVRKLRRARPEPAPSWAPDRNEAEALLADADTLAAAGRFDEATHLLLRRSVRQIAEARPDWVRPASTARELGELSALPSRARQAFAVIAARVERSRYALRPLALDDWQAARQAYADFALVEIAA